MAARALPGPVCSGLCRVLASTYYLAQPRRREIVVQNVLPALENDRERAEQMARAVFRQFALKMADLWRHEAGQPFDNCFSELCGWEHFVAAQARGRGALIITPHLGNWELGGPLLVQRGVRLLVITQSEPGNGFTELRQKLRARWGVETLVIGQEAFAFLEIIRRLQEGAAVALLIDRPPPSGAVEVELFGRPFLASKAAAELAWASGCALLGVYILRSEHGYAAHLMPEFVYEQSALKRREVRRELTQQILRAFEPVIRQHLDQWYHFVPIWTAAARD